MDIHVKEKKKTISIISCKCKGNRMKESPPK